MRLIVLPILCGYLKDIATCLALHVLTVHLFVDRVDLLAVVAGDVDHV
ncbi:MAG: hypothetical protein N2C12_04570 [Planctomycetales bacterium]